MREEESLSGIPEDPSGDNMHHSDAAAIIKIDYISVFSALHLFFLFTLAHRVKFELFSSLCNLSVCPVKTNNTELTLIHDLERERVFLYRGRNDCSSVIQCSLVLVGLTQQHNT